MKPVTSRDTLGLVIEGYCGPTLLGGGAVCKAHLHGVWEPLRKEVAGDSVFIFP
jgi:hypothetical protein